MKVSVVLTTKNEEKNIKNLLDSLMEQEKPYEVIVVDSDSKDRTRKIVEEYSKKNKNIKLFVHPGTRAESMNYGIKQATGDVIAFIGGDDIADKNWIREIRKTMKFADIAVGSHLPKKGEKIKRPKNVALFHKGVNVSYPGANTIYKREVIEKLGGFDPWFSSAEDLEINIRAIELGYKITENKNIKIYSTAKDTPIQFLKQSFWYGYGRRLIALKHGNIWKKHSIKETLKTQLNFLGLIRLIIGFVGYVYCLVKVKGYPKKDLLINIK